MYQTKRASLYPHECTFKLLYVSISVQLLMYAEGLLRLLILLLFSLPHLCEDVSLIGLYFKIMLNRFYYFQSWSLFFPKVPAFILYLVVCINLCLWAALHAAPLRQQHPIWGRSFLDGTLGLTSIQRNALWIKSCLSTVIMKGNYL